jgi:hypothetical protein
MATLAIFVETVRKVVLEKFVDLTARRLYQDLFDNMSRALILCTMQIGLRHRKCQQEAFKYLPQPPGAVSLIQRDSVQRCHPPLGCQCCGGPRGHVAGLGPDD